MTYATDTLPASPTWAGNQYQSRAHVPIRKARLSTVASICARRTCDYRGVPSVVWISPAGQVFCARSNGHGVPTATTAGYVGKYMAKHRGGVDVLAADILEDLNFVLAENKAAP